MHLKFLHPIQLMLVFLIVNSAWPPVQAQAGIINGNVYKICARDNTCLSAYEEGEIGRHVGKVSTEHFRGFPAQKWKAHAYNPYDRHDPNLTWFTPTVDEESLTKYNNIAQVLHKGSARALAVGWKVIPVENNLYRLRGRFTHRVKDSENVFKCLQYQGKGLNVKLAECDNGLRSQLWSIEEVE